MNLDFSTGVAEVDDILGAKLIAESNGTFINANEAAPVIKAAPADKPAPKPKPVAKAKPKVVKKAS